MSRILNVSPFSDDILDLNQSQQEWIITMYDKTNPGKVKFTSTQVSTVLLGLRKWTEVLEGSALTEWLRKRVPEYRKENVQG